MAETAESVIIAIEAQMNTASVAQGTSVVTGAMSEVERSATQAEVAVKTSSTKIVESHTRMGASGMILQHVVRSTADQFASGAPAAQIFAQHIGMIGEAAALSGESMGKFGAFMAGPWGLAVSAGVSLLTVLIAGHRGAGDAAKEHETFEQTLIRALHGEADAIDKVTESMRARNDAVREGMALDTDRMAHQRAGAVGEAGVAQGSLAQLRSDLATAQSALHEALTFATHPGVGPEVAQARVADLTRQVAVAEANLAGVEARVTNVDIQASRARITNEERVNAQFDVLQTNMENAARRARAVAPNDQAYIARINAALDAQERQLAQTRLAGVEPARRLDQMQQQLNRDYSAVPFSEVRSRIIANEAPASLGGYNAIAFNNAGGGNRYGVPQANLVAMTIGQVLDYQLNTIRPLTRNHPNQRDPRGIGSTGAGAYQFEHDTLRQNAEQTFGAGYASQRFTPENQDRIAETLYNRVRGNPTALRNTWAAFQPGHQGPGDNAASEAERQAHEAIALAARRRQDEDHFQEELAGLNADLANARRQQIQTVQQAADFEIQQIEEQRVQKDRRLQVEADNESLQDEASRATYQAHARQLIAINDQTAEVRKGAVRVRLQQQLDEQRIQIAEIEIHDQESILQARASLARTALERRDIELRLLDLQHQEEILAIQKQRAQQNLSPDQRAQLDRDEAASNTRYGLAQQNVRRQTQGPLDQFFDQIPKTAQEMNEALQHVAVDGLTQLNDGLAQAASRFLHLGGIAGSVLDTILNDLIRIVLQQAELAASGKGGGWSGFLSNIASLVGAAPGGSGGGLPAGNNQWAQLANLGGSFGGGRATGGPVRAGVPYIVGENGQELFVPDQHGVIIPQGKALSFGGARAASGAPQITVISAPQFDLRGVITTPQLMREVDRVSRAHAAQAAAAMGQGVLKAMPARLVQYQSDGL